MDHRRHIQIAHGFIQRVPVFVAERQVLPVTAGRVGVQVAADEAHLLDAAAKLGDACPDRGLRALRQLADWHEVCREQVADTPDQVVAMLGPGLRGAGVADMMAHPAGARREDGDVRAAFLLDTKLVGLDALANLVVADRHHALAADVVGVCGDGLFLRVAPGGDARRGGGVMAVAINDHGTRLRTLFQLLNCFSTMSITCIAGRHWARLEFGSRPSRMAATNSRSISSMPLVETSTLLTSIWLSRPSNKSS